MLDNLPAEIVEQILGHLPTASSIVNLACTNHKLHEIISKNDYGAFKDFVQRAFPTIRTPPIWRDMACRLTSRSRAWQRKGIFGRECYPPVDDSSGFEALTLSSKFGFTPVIDSYEDFSKLNVAARTEVVAYGAAGRIRVRTTAGGKSTWSTMRFPDDHLPQNDVVDIRLLRPHQNQNSEGESIIITRANKEVTMVESRSPEGDKFVQVSRYVTGTSSVNCTAVSDQSDPRLVVFDEQTIQLFPVHGDNELVRPDHVSRLLPEHAWLHRKRCAKFLTGETIAASVQFVQGAEKAPILIYDITPTGLVDTQLYPVDTLFPDESCRPGRHAACSLVPLDSIGSVAGQPGKVFLSGWTDGISRLYDLRASLSPVTTYWDPIDDGQVLCLAPIGHEKFFAGGHQNACLKMFDLRMSGAKCYSHLEAMPTNVLTNSKSAPQLSPRRSGPGSFGTRDINIFLAITTNRNGPLWQRAASSNTRGGRRNPRNYNRALRYQGSIYSLSSPSPSSPTLFVGIENHVVQLDFVCVDDAHFKSEGTKQPYQAQSTLSTSNPREILALSCYERPRLGSEATDPVLLRKQVEWIDFISGSDGDVDGDMEPGWDERWRIGRSWKSGGDNPWRRS